MTGLKFLKLHETPIVYHESHTEVHHTSCHQCRCESFQLANASDYMWKAPLMNPQRFQYRVRCRCGHQH
uniref:Bursicon n=1 Tax=Acrobeloides nanus TaxID=290746 RepID=A0A914CJK3_9BILA